MLFANCLTFGDVSMVRSKFDPRKFEARFLMIDRNSLEKNRFQLSLFPSAGISIKFLLFFILFLLPSRVVCT